MIQIIDKVIDRMIQLAREKNRAYEKLFTRMIEPTYASFNLVHGNYLTSFQDYREALLSTTDPLTTNHPIFRKICEDTVSSQHLRNKLAAMASFDLGERFEALLKALLAYLHHVSSDMYVSGFKKISVSDSDSDIYINGLRRSVSRKDSIEGDKEAARSSNLFAFCTEGTNRFPYPWLALQLVAHEGVIATTEVPLNAPRQMLVGRLLKDSELDLGNNDRLRAAVHYIDMTLSVLQNNHSQVEIEYTKLRQIYSNS